MVSYIPSSVLMMIKARQVLIASATAEGRLEGLIPTPQEFHKEMLLLQVNWYFYGYCCVYLVTISLTLRKPVKVCVLLLHMNSH